MQQGFLHRKDSPTVDENLNAMTCNTSGAALSNFSNFHTASIDQMCKISDSVPSDYTARTPPALTSALQIREPDVPAPDFYEDDIIRMYSRKAQHQILHVHSGAGTPEDKYMSRISEYQDSKVEPALISKLESILATGRRKQKCPRHNNPGPYSREDLEYFDLQGTCSLVSFIFDTGASISISDVSLNKFLHNDTRSTVSISIRILKTSSRTSLRMNARACTPRAEYSDPESTALHSQKYRSSKFPDRQSIRKLHTTSLHRSRCTSPT